MLKIRVVYEIKCFTTSWVLANEDAYLDAAREEELIPLFFVLSIFLKHRVRVDKMGPLL